MKKVEDRKRQGLRMKEIEKDKNQVEEVGKNGKRIERKSRVKMEKKLKRMRKEVKLKGMKKGVKMEKIERDEKEDENEKNPKIIH